MPARSESSSPAAWAVHGRTSRRSDLDPIGSDAASGRRPDGPHGGLERLCPRNRRNGHPAAALPRCGRRLPRERADRVARNRGADRFSAPCRPACRSRCPGAAGAEVPIVSVEVALAAIFLLHADRSPRCPWCVLVIAVAITAAAVIGLRRISERRRYGGQPESTDSRRPHPAPAPTATA